MKATSIALACAFALASAAHAQTTGSSGSGGAYTPPDSAQSPAQLDGEKGRQALRKAGDATKRAFNRARGKVQEQRQEARSGDRERRDPAQTMGAQSTTAGAPSASTTMADAGSDASRRARMDAAYDNWKKTSPNR